MSSNSPTTPIILKSKLFYTFKIGLPEKHISLVSPYQNESKNFLIQITNTCFPSESIVNSSNPRYFQLNFSFLVCGSCTTEVSPHASFQSSSQPPGLVNEKLDGQWYWGTGDFPTIARRRHTVSEGRVRIPITCQYPYYWTCWAQYKRLWPNIPSIPVTRKIVRVPFAVFPQYLQRCSHVSLHLGHKYHPTRYGCDIYKTWNERRVSIGFQCTHPPLPPKPSRSSDGILYIQ